MCVLGRDNWGEGSVGAAEHCRGTGVLIGPGVEDTAVEALIGPGTEDTGVLIDLEVANRRAAFLGPGVEDMKVVLLDPGVANIVDRGLAVEAANMLGLPEKQGVAMGCLEE